MEPSDAFFGLLYLSAFIIVIYVFLLNRNSATAMIEEEPSTSEWWPWRMTPYNWWPRWLSGRPVPQSIPVRANVVAGPSFDRPWGGGSRYANGGAAH